MKRRLFRMAQQSDLSDDCFSRSKPRSHKVGDRQRRRFAMTVRAMKRALICAIAGQDGAYRPKLLLEKGRNGVKPNDDF